MTNSHDEERPLPPVAVIGTGTMGSAMARRVLSAGMTVAVWNRSPEPVVALAELGASAYDDPKDAVADATVVLTMLPTAAAVTDLMIGRGVIDALAPKAVWAQMGTVGVEGTEQLAAEVAGRRPDVGFVDAPVSGGRHPAETGQLEVLASGPETTIGPLAPVSTPSGAAPCGSARPARTVGLKLVLNTWLAFEVEAAAEAASLATRLGIAPEVLADALDANPLASPLASAKLAKMQSGDDPADFSLEWALKDLDLMSASVGPQDAPIALAIADRWRALVDQGFGRLDVSAARFGLGDEEPTGLGGTLGPATTAVPSGPTGVHGAAPTSRGEGS